MILKIILAVVIVKILIDILGFKEGYLDLDPTPLNHVGDSKPKTDNCNVNIVFCPYDPVTNTVTNGNNCLYHNFRNIQKASNPDDC